MSGSAYRFSIAGSCLAVFAACAFAQAPAPAAGAPSPSTTAATATTSAQKAQPGTQKRAAAKTQHAKKQHNAMHTTRAKASNATPRESQYRTALRRCVEGVPARRDQCLNDAIARYGRS